MSEFTGYYYNHQFRNYIVQFMAIFAGMQVEVGKTGDKEPRLIKVPITYGSKDRVVADIIAENTQNKPLQIPIMSTYLANIELAPELRKGLGTSRRQTVMPIGGEFPTDFEVVSQRQPVPYRAYVELSMFVSNTQQHHQILEQILMIFDPIVQIQATEDLHDWTKITTVELTGVRLEENHPSGADRRIIQSTLDFTFPVYVSVPADVHKQFIEDIYIRVGAVNEILGSSEDIIADLDDQNIPYELTFSLDDIVLPE